MTLIRGLDNQGDWLFGHGMIDYRSKKEGIGLDVVTRIKEWKYDWFADYEKGIDWRTRLGSKNQKELLDEDIQNVIEETRNIVSITGFESTLDTSQRVYTAQVAISTVYGEDKLELKVGG